MLQAFKNERYIVFCICSRLKTVIRFFDMFFFLVGIDETIACFLNCMLDSSILTTFDKQIVAFLFTTLLCINFIFYHNSEVCLNHFWK